jgi:hypothetical protein
LGFGRQTRCDYHAHHVEPCLSSLPLNGPTNTKWQRSGDPASLCKVALHGTLLQMRPVQVLIVMVPTVGALTCTRRQKKIGYSSPGGPRPCTYFNKGLCSERADHTKNGTLRKHVCRRCCAVEHVEGPCPLGSTGMSDREFLLSHLQDDFNEIHPLTSSTFAFFLLSFSRLTSYILGIFGLN